MVSEEFADLVEAETAERVQTSTEEKRLELEYELQVQREKLAAKERESKLELEAKEREKKLELEQALQKEKLELEVREREKRLELEYQSKAQAELLAAQARVQMAEAERIEVKTRMIGERTHFEPLVQAREATFDATRQIRLVPPFQEKDVDAYFETFEDTASTLKWPPDCWSILLATVIMNVLSKPPAYGLYLCILAGKLRCLTNSYSDHANGKPTNECGSLPGYWRDVSASRRGLYFANF